MSDPYSFEIPGLGTTFAVERLRRERNELIGELSVKTSLAGAQLVNGYLSTGDFNFSSIRARQDRAKLLAQRARTNGQFDWFALLEDFCQKVFAAEREGDPAVDLRSLPRPIADDGIRVEGMSFPRRHPTIVFGDGGAAKSYTALYWAGKLSNLGLTVALFDWELASDDHRERLELLFGANMPRVLYCRCERPLTAEIDRLRRMVADHKVDYAIFDSVAIAAHGRPEDAEVAAGYFRALRQIDCGSLHIAHVNKSEESDRKPFGSSFWHNLARSTWFMKSEELPAGQIQLALYNRKANLSSIQPPVSYLVTFGSRTVYDRVAIETSVELAAGMSIRDRMHRALKQGSMTIAELSEQMNVTEEEIQKTAQCGRRSFILLSGGRVGNVDVSRA